MDPVSLGSWISNVYFTSERGNHLKKIFFLNYHLPFILSYLVFPQAFQLHISLLPFREWVTINHLFLEREIIYRNPRVGAACVVMLTAAFLRGNRTVVARSPLQPTSINSNRAGTKHLNKHMNRPCRFYHRRTLRFFQGMVGVAHLLESSWDLKKHCENQRF